VRSGIAAKQEFHSICENMMDNCLASNSETGGGVGCDNMTMIIVGLLQGKTKEEGSNMIGKRVANGGEHCAPPVGLDAVKPCQHSGLPQNEVRRALARRLRRGWG
jgi:protein phosphatase PTC2/3